jgi:hypothetical protein
MNRLNRLIQGEKIVDYAANVVDKNKLHHRVLPLTIVEYV